jgi:hypothetical protein
MKHQSRGRPMSELDQLKRENKKLKALLKTAVDLLNKSKDALTHAATPKEKNKKKKAKAKS